MTPFQGVEASSILVTRSKKMSKYQPLWEFIRETKKTDFQLSFAEIKNVLNFEIDHAFLTYKKELKEYGYEVKKISLKEKYVLFSQTKN